MATRTPVAPFKYLSCQIQNTVQQKHRDSLELYILQLTTYHDKNYWITKNQQAEERVDNDDQEVFSSSLYTGP